MRVESDGASFEKPAEAYARFVGRYSGALAETTISRLGLRSEWDVLDVGCGPGPLTGALIERADQGSIAAVDPSEQFASACAERHPEADVRVAPAEELPFEDGSFDAVLSQLVINFLPDPGVGLTEMRRVAKQGGILAASVWDYTDGMTMLRSFWNAAVTTDPEGAGPLDEARRMKPSTPDALTELWEATGLLETAVDAITVSGTYENFEDLWHPFTLGVGPAGSYCASLSAERQARLAEAYRRSLGSPDGPFELSARAWLVRGRAP